MDCENPYRKISHPTLMSLLQADGANKKGSVLFFHVDHNVSNYKKPFHPLLG